jgi:hypothetical protein
MVVVLPRTSCECQGIEFYTEGLGYTPYGGRSCCVCEARGQVRMRYVDGKERIAGPGLFLRDEPSPIGTYLTYGIGRHALSRECELRYVFGIQSL